MGGLFECNECDYKSKSKAKLTSHHNSVHENIKYKCDICGYQLSTKGNLTNSQYMREGNNTLVALVTIRQL